jgi:uncharacterized membrane protein
MMELESQDAVGKEVAVRETVSVQTQWLAPIPPPEMMRQYNDIMADAADRILAMAEREAASRHANDAAHIANETAHIINNSAQIANDTLHLEAARDDGKAYRKKVWLGQLFTFVIIIFGITASVVCARMNQPWVAGVLGGSTLISVVNAMLNAKGKPPRKTNPDAP